MIIKGFNSVGILKTVETTQDIYEKYGKPI